MTTSRTVRRILAATSLAALTAGAAPLAPALAADGGVTQERLLDADKEEGNWIQHHKNFAGHRYSTLNQINKDTVKNLKVAWTMALGGIESGGIWSHGGLEGTPIVENGMMYVTDGWGSVYKIEHPRRRGQAPLEDGPEDRPRMGRRGRLLRRQQPRRRALGRPRGQPHPRRTPDRHQQGDRPGRLAAPGRRSDKGETITGAPLIVKGMAISGVGGAEYGIRGWIAATDLKTEKEVWRTHTIPGKGEPGSETWKARTMPPSAAAARPGDRHLRSRHRHHRLGRRQSGPGLGQRLPAGRQPLHRLDAGARCHDRQDQVALPAHAERPLRL